MITYIILGIVIASVISWLWFDTRAVFAEKMEEIEFIPFSWTEPW